MSDRDAERLRAQHACAPRMTRLCQRLARVEEPCHALADEAARHGALQLILGRLEDGAATLHGGVAAAAWASKRALIRALVKRVAVARNDVNMVLRIAPYPSDNDPEKKVGNFVGGEISPILANIYLHEFDAFMEQKKRECDRGKERREGKEWHNVTYYLQYYRKRIDTLKGDSTPDAVATRKRYEQKVQELLARQKRLPASDPLDPNYRRLHYVRYADGTPVQA